MNIVILDAKKLAVKSEAHDYLKRMLGFPDWYGKNLDALYDCLGDLPRDTLVIVCETASLSDYAARVLSVFRESAASGAFRLIEK